MQILSFENEDREAHAVHLKTDYTEYIALLKDKRIIITSFVICISTSSLAILELCVPMWLLAKYDPPPSRWQLGAVFIPDSFGYFIGSNFAGKDIVFEPAH